MALVAITKGNGAMQLNLVVSSSTYIFLINILHPHAALAALAARFNAPFAVFAVNAVHTPPSYLPRNTFSERYKLKKQREIKIRSFKI